MKPANTKRITVALPVAWLPGVRAHMRNTGIALAPDYVRAAVWEKLTRSGMAPEVRP